MSEGHDQVIELLLSDLKEKSFLMSAQINDTLASAATYGRDSMALHILKSEADMNFKVDIVHFSTPLILAASNWHESMVCKVS